MPWEPARCVNKNRTGCEGAPEAVEVKLCPQFVIFLLFCSIFFLPSEHGDTRRLTVRGHLYIWAFVCFLASSPDAPRGASEKYLCHAKNKEGSSLYLLGLCFRPRMLA